MWLYHGREFTEDMIEDNVGFVYLIENITNGKKYIGKKLFTKSKIYQKNKKKKRTRVQSDWISYTGSNELLNEDIKSGHVVKKYILVLCKSKGECSYYETREQFDQDVLFDENYYNAWIQCKIRRSHLKRK